MKTSSGNIFPRKIPENSEKSLPVLVLNLGDISAFQYCTGNFQAPKLLGVSETSWDLQGFGAISGLERQFGQTPRLSGVRKRVVFKNGGFEG